ncbi:serine/threonine-protein kinase [Streptomyces sp. E-15]
MGEVFAGRYELADPIGRGGVGAVWRAWDHRRRRYVAAKVLQQRDAHSLLRFVREQGLRIDHPHVLAPASWAADDDKVLFTMDLVGGGSLVNLVNDYGPLPPGFVCTLLDQLLSGLAAVHAENVVHRDIKPANVLLEATGTGRPRLRLSDFGIAMRLGEPRLTETNLVVGTPGYLAPEQMVGAEPDFPSDLFAVGLVALYLLEGARPDAKALVRYFEANGTPGPPKGIPEPLWQVVASLLQPDPAHRFRTATGARKALAAAAELLPEPGIDDELIDVFDQLGPLPPGFAPDGPLQQASGVALDLLTDPTPAPASAPAPVSGKAPAPVSGKTPGMAPGTDSGADSGGDAGDDFGTGDFATGGSNTGTGTDTGPGTGSDAGASVSPAMSADARPRPDQGPHSAPTPTPTPTPTGSLSDTGSFRLPPPTRPPAPTPNPFPAPPPVPSPPDRWPEPIPDPPPAPPGDSTTAAYTARAPHAAPHTPPPPGLPATPSPSSAPPPAPGTTPRRAGSHRARRAPRRTGPPARAVIPILLLALVCYAVGFWALTRG